LITIKEKKESESNSFEATIEMDGGQDISYRKSFVVSSSWNFCWKWIVTLIYYVVVVIQHLSKVAVQVTKDRKNADVKRKLREEPKGKKQNKQN